MNKLKTYVLATAGLFIIGAAFTVIGPYVDLGHSKPPQADETMVITIVEDLTQGGITEFDAVDMTGFRFVSFHGRTDINIDFNFRFSTQAGRFSDDIPKNRLAFCRVNSGVGADCFNFQGMNESSFRVSGPFLLVQLEDAQNTTVQVFLSR